MDPAQKKTMSFSAEIDTIANRSENRNTVTTHARGLTGAKTGLQTEYTTDFNPVLGNNHRKKAFPSYLLLNVMLNMI